MCIRDSLRAKRSLDQTQKQFATAAQAMGPARAIFIGGFCVSQQIWRLPASAINLSRARGPRRPAAVAALGTGLGCRNGRARPRFRGPPAIGETPCRLKPRPTGPRAPGGRWVSGGFLRPAVCFGPARPATGRRPSAGAGVQRLLGSGARRLDISGEPHTGQHFVTTGWQATEGKLLSSEMPRA